MKTNHGMNINRRMKENYEHILDKMTSEERAWAEKFERMEYAIERGFAKEAVRIAKELNPNVSAKTINDIKEDVAIKKRCNPAKMESDVKSKKRSAKTAQERTGNMYDPYDWFRNAGTIYIKEEDAEEERGITLNPEDALIDALDAAAKHGVSLEEFANNPAYWTPERKPGRPKKNKE